MRENRSETRPQTPSHIPPAMFIESLAHQMYPEDKAAAQQFAMDVLTGSIRTTAELSMRTQVAGKERDFPIELIKVFETKHISRQPGEPTAMALTSRLNGCVATVIVAETEQGREVVFSHFPSFLKEENLASIDSMLTPAMRVGERKKIFMLVDANRKGKDVVEFRDSIHELVGEDTDLIVQEYRVDPEHQDSGVLLVKIPPPGEQPVSMHTWEKSQDIQLDQREE